MIYDINNTVERKNFFQIRSKNPHNYSYIIETKSLARHLVSHFSSMTIRKKSKITDKAWYIAYIIYHSVDSFLEISGNIKFDYRLLNGKKLHNPTPKELLSQSSQYGNLNIREFKKTCRFRITKLEGRYTHYELTVSGRVFNITSKYGSGTDVYFKLSYNDKVIVELNDADDTPYIREEKIGLIV